MAGNEMAKDIENGLNALAGGVKDTGRKRNAELVAKQGYVAFRNPDAVAKFHADPFYTNWNYTYIDGEYRFFPPQNKQTLTQTKSEQQDSQMLEIYKQAIADSIQSTFIAVTIFQDDLSKCKYSLSTIDKRTGERKIVQEVIVDFDGRFSMETIPSLYNKLCDGVPAIDYENERGISFQNMDNSKMMGFGNLTPEQKQLIQNMKQFVDNQNINMQPTQSSEMHR